MSPTETTTTTVMDLRTGEFRVYLLPPLDAVIAAYAQVERGDYNTWNYSQYRPLVVRAGRCLSCGNQSCKIPE